MKERGEKEKKSGENKEKKAGIDPVPATPSKPDHLDVHHSDHVAGKRIGFATSFEAMVQTDTVNIITVKPR